MLQRSTQMCIRDRAPCGPMVETRILKQAFEYMQWGREIVGEPGEMVRHFVKAERTIAQAM